ncbi:MAG: beta-ketoacyl-[acyl-carrier-protein] synthase family protein [Acidobacteria bacterium]|nr:beta-ketoacyl-[acyl-carrier-protein] synthase family protein [Acidobacteriota bacterium]MBP8275011.1 beta-ketoacyl-[acyl-carrier-protein] synthase family protein [Acidobacteriota bacterium]
MTTSRDRRRVVITGMGVISAAGCDTTSFWNRLVAGESAIDTIQQFDASAYPSRIAAEVRDRDLPPLDTRWHGRGRIARFAAAAADLAIKDAHVQHSATWPQAGVVIAAGMGSYTHDEVFVPCALARAGQPNFDWPGFTAALRAGLAPHAAERLTPGSLPALIAHQYGLQGPVMAVMTACAGGTQAIGDALRWIRHGRADIVVAGGADSEIYPMGLASFCLLGALSKRNDAPALASRPFDGERDGFVLGEGAAVLVLEAYDHAVARGARIYAEVAGFGSASDAYRVTDPHPDGVGARLAMTRAMADAGLTPAEIDYINAHGTSTQANDRIETLAVRRVFGDTPPPISSTKSMIGHATVAAGAIEAVACALTLMHQQLHPTINQRTPDPQCDLDYVADVARAARVETVLSNSFAFGGQSASLVLRRVHD